MMEARLSILFKSAEEYEIVERYIFMCNSVFFNIRVYRQCSEDFAPKGKQKLRPNKC